MPAIRRVVAVPAPVEAVFDFLTDYRSGPRLLPALHRLEPLTPEWRRLGGQFRGTAVVRGIRLTFGCVVSDLAAPERIGAKTTWIRAFGRFPLPGAHARARWWLESTETGTDATLELVYGLGWAPLTHRLWARLLGADLVASRVEDALRTLHRIFAEAKRAPGVSRR